MELETFDSTSANNNNKNNENVKIKDPQKRPLLGQVGFVVFLFFLYFIFFPQYIEIEPPSQTSLATPQLTSINWPKRFNNIRKLDSPVQDFGQLHVDLSDDEDDKSEAIRSRPNMSPHSGKGSHDGASPTESEVSFTSEVEPEFDEKDPESWFRAVVSPAHDEFDKKLLKIQAEYLEENNFYQLHKYWIRSGNLRGNLIDSVSYTVLRDVMMGLINTKPCLFWLNEKGVEEKETAYGVQLSSHQAAENLIKVLALLLRNVDLVSVALKETSSVADLVNAVWKRKNMSSRPPLFIISSHSVLRQSVEYALLDLINTGIVSNDGEENELKGKYWCVFVANALESGFSYWIKRECLVSSQLTFGKPVGELVPEIGPKWLNYNSVILRSIHMDQDLARWTRDLVMLLRISPFLQCHVLPPGLSDMMQLCARTVALTHGRTYAVPQDFKKAFKIALQHHVAVRPGFAITASEVLEAAYNNLTLID